MYLLTDVTKLKKLRTAAGISMKELSRRAGLPENAILRVENGKTKRINHLRAREIAKALGCRVDDIFTERKGA